MAEVDHFRFGGPPLSSLRTCRLHRLRLWGDQWLTAELLSFDDAGVLVRTAWQRELVLPRTSVAEIRHPPGWITVVADDFEDEARVWKLGDDSFVRVYPHFTGKRSLCLMKPGQAAEYVVKDDFASGRIGVNFRIPPETAGARWQVEADFNDSGKAHTIRAILAGEKPAYEVEVDDARVEQYQLPRAAGWHRLTLQYAAGFQSVAVDNAVLWASAHDTVRRALRRVRLACVATAKPSAVMGEVAFDDFCLERGLDELPHVWEDPNQDEVWLLSGDSLFGRVVAANQRQVELAARFGSRIFEWSQVRAVYLRRRDQVPRWTYGEHVRVRLRTYLGFEPDQLTGSVRSLDPLRLVLSHASLGDIEIDRARPERLRWSFRGRRLELDNAHFHLGKKVIPALDVPRPDGIALRRSFRLAAIPDEVVLVVCATQLKGLKDDVARKLEQGALRTEVWLNGERVDYLNRFVERATRTPQSIELALPRPHLRIGENVLELRQTPDGESGEYADCGIVGLAIELPGMPGRR